MTDKLRGEAEVRRGWCTHCQRDIRLKKDGTLRHHGGAVGSGIWEDYRSYACKGVGELPADESGVSL